MGAQQPRGAQRAQRNGHEQGDGAAHQMSGRHGGQADGQGEDRDGGTGEAGGVGAVLEGFSGVLTGGTGMVDRGFLG
ncbi:hypothetical protein MYSE111917_18825 [Mycobacterium senriense]|uniref:PE-PGRS family protein n=1 Tax=Mycobacterium senriense TaxID=2775496 RepID=A0ABN6IGS4_9MYCO|nr:hypothetical protein [Mycobacterium senriense]BCZ22439.1 hypothetical protein MTY59_22940 [Mycobacterium senriense]